MVDIDVLNDFLEAGVIQSGQYSAKQVAYALNSMNISKLTGESVKTALDFLEGNFYADNVHDFVDLAKKVYGNYDNSEFFDWQLIANKLRKEGGYDIVDGKAFTVLNF